MDNIKRPADMERYILKHFDEALAKGYIKVYVQPVVRTLTRQCCGMEALTTETIREGMLLVADQAPTVETIRAAMFPVATPAKTLTVIPAVCQARGPHPSVPAPYLP